MNLSELVRAAAKRTPDHTALRFGELVPERSVTYAELDREVDRVAAGLRRRGILPGDRVALAMHNVVHFAFAYFGILRCGAVAVPLNTMLSEQEVEAVLRDCEPKGVLGAPPFMDAVAAAASRVPSIAGVLSTERWEEIGDVERVDPPDGASDDLAVLAYTSGTTGAPKGVMLSHGNLRASLEQQMSLDEHVSEQDVLLLALPLFHIYGLNVTLGLTVLNAATGVLLERFEPIASLRVVQQHGVSVLFGAPTMFSAWLQTPGAEQYDLSSVRLAVSGAAPLPVEVLEGFRDVFGVEIFEGYGLTETAPTVATDRVGPSPRPGSVGLPMPGVEVRVVDEEGDDVELGDPGELLVKGPNVFRGYWRRPELTEEAFVDGWFRTGDIAVRDEEGYVYLVDRKRDLIIVSGFNVFPSEVEDALVAHPSIAAAGVVGAPHRYTGESVKAYVVLERDANVGEADVVEWLRGRLARFKLPESIEFVDELPHLLTGKVLRRALRT